MQQLSGLAALLLVAACSAAPTSPAAPETGTSTRAGLIFAYRDANPEGEAGAVAQAIALGSAVRADQPYAMVGASLGGRVVIEAAARHPTGLAAIVSLSGERFILRYRDILGDARRVSTPALYIGDESDPLTDRTRQPQQLHRAMRGHPNEIMVLHGSDHGIQLIEDPAVVDRVETFLTARLR
jgi:pimeloyl-ACP methyl ester carboxylesterase